MNNIMMFFRHWDGVNNVTLKLIKQMPEDKLDLKPTEKNFTFKELVAHIYQSEKVFADTCLIGELKIEDFKESPAPGIKTVDELYNYAKEVHENTKKVVAGLSDEDLMTKIVKAPWGDMPIFFHLNGVYEHLLHHRGQMYIYLRMAGVENPVFMYEGAEAPEHV